MKTSRVANLLVTSIFLTLISAGATYYNVREKNKYTTLIMQANDIIRKSTELNLHLANLGNFDRANLRDQKDGLYPKIYGTYDTLLKLTAGDPIPSDILRQQVQPQIGSFIERVENDSSSATASFETSPQLSRSLQQVIDHEDRLLRERRVQLKNIYAVNDTVHYASFVLTCIISGLALKTLLEKEKRNKELLASVHEANTTLEMNVQERTAELEKKTFLAEKLNRDLQDNFNELQSFYDSLHSTNAKAEDTLNEMRDLYENAPSGYHSLDANGLIVRMNQTELNWLGYTRDEVVGKMPVTQIIAPEEHTSYKSDFSTFLKQGYIRNKGHTFVRKDGSRFKVLLNATAIYDERGQFVMSRGVSYLLLNQEQNPRNV